MLVYRAERERLCVPFRAVARRKRGRLRSSPFARGVRIVAAGQPDKGNVTFCSVISITCGSPIGGVLRFRRAIFKQWH